MPYAKTTCKIPLCKTDAEAYHTTSQYVEIVVVGTAKECLAHRVDLDFVDGITANEPKMYRCPCDVLIECSMRHSCRRCKTYKEWVETVDKYSVDDDIRYMYEEQSVSVPPYDELPTCKSCHHPINSSGNHMFLKSMREMECRCGCRETNEKPADVNDNAMYHVKCSYPDASDDWKV